MGVIQNYACALQKCGITLPEGFRDELELVEKVYPGATNKCELALFKFGISLPYGFQKELDIIQNAKKKRTRPNWFKLWVVDMECKDRPHGRYHRIKTFPKGHVGRTWDVAVAYNGGFIAKFASFAPGIITSGALRAFISFLPKEVRRVASKRLEPNGEDLYYMSVDGYITKA